MYVLVFTCFPLSTLRDNGIYGSNPYENAYQWHHQMPKHKNKKYLSRSTLIIISKIGQMVGNFMKNIFQTNSLCKSGLGTSSRHFSVSLEIPVK